MPKVTNEICWSKFSLTRGQDAALQPHSIVEMMKGYSRSAPQLQRGELSDAASEATHRLCGNTIALDGKDFAVGPLLGAGCRSIVLAATATGGNDAALKFSTTFPGDVTLEKALKDTDSAEQNFFTEALVLSRLAKAEVQGVPRFLSAAIVRQPAESIAAGIIAMERRPGAELSGRLLEFLERPSNHSLLKQILADAFDIAHRVSEQGVVLTELSASNLLVNVRSGVATVSAIDFGNTEIHRGRLTKDIKAEYLAASSREVGRVWETDINSQMQLLEQAENRPGSNFCDELADVLLPLADGEILLDEAARRLRGSC